MIPPIASPALLPGHSAYPDFWDGAVSLWAPALRKVSLNTTGGVHGNLKDHGFAHCGFNKSGGGSNDPCPFGNSLAFNGSGGGFLNSTVSQFVHNFIHQKAVFTIAGCIKSNSLSSTLILLDNALGTTNNTGFFVYQDSSGRINVSVTRSSAGNFVVNGLTTSSLTSSQWATFVATCDGATLRIFLNGRKNGADASVGTLGSGNSSQTLGLGSTGGGGNSSVWNGNVAFVGIWNKPLSPDFAQMFAVDPLLLFRRKKSVSAFNPYKLGSTSLLGEATVNVASLVKKLGSASLLGEATVSPSGFTIHRASTSLIGEATVSAAGIDAIFRQGASYLIGQATDSTTVSTIPYVGGGSGNPAGQVIRTVTQQELSGDRVDFGNDDQFRLTVDGFQLDLTSTSRFNLEDLDFNYESKTVRFSEITGIDSPTYQLENSVVITIDFGSGFKSYFSGKIKTREHTGKNNNEGIMYTAVGMHSLANDVVVRNEDGIPSVTFTGFIQVALEGFPGEQRYALASPLSMLIPNYFALMAPYLAEEGIPATIGTPGADTFTAVMFEDLNLTNTTFTEGLKRIVAAQPGKKVWYDDTTETWTFPQLFDVPIIDLRVQSINLPENVYNLDSTSRYTAITIIGDYMEEGSTDRATLVLTPTWDSSLELDWTIQKGMGLTNAASSLADYFWVYRRWQLPNSVGQASQFTPFALYQLVSHWGQQRWMSIDAMVDWRQQQVISKVPLVTDGNPFIPGDAVGPLAVVLTYAPRNGVSLPFIRWPHTGYQGTAYTMLGIQRVKYEMVGGEELTSANAEARLALLQDVQVNGDIVLEGDILEEFINLQRTVRITSSERMTGLETLGAMQMGFKYECGKRGKNLLQLNNDYSAIIRTK